MKVSRHAKIIELISQYDIETQEELAEYLNNAGFKVTQATVSRDIRDLKLTKISVSGGRQKYVIHRQEEPEMNEKYIRVLRDGYVSMDMAQNILVIKTVSGMAMAVAAAVDAMKWHEVVGCIAGDDTIMCAIRTAEDTSVVTSGPYERYFEKDGVRYHHIIDPATGRPARSGLASVTVVDADSARADALCTALFVMGSRRAPEFLEGRRDVRAVLVTEDKRVLITPSAEKIFRLTDESLALSVIGAGE